MAESTLSTFVASDGENIAIQDWPLEYGRRLRGVVLLVHGLAEHAGRYDHVARRLNDWGFAVRGYDQYGHGESGGVRGGLPHEQRLLDDLADVLDSTRVRMAPATPLILFGHSLGGLVATRFVSLQLRPVDGLVLSSPALDPGLNAWQKLLLAVLPRLAPDLCVRNGLDPRLISHDPAVVRAYQQDPLIHDRISGRLARFIVDAAAATRIQAAQWRVPTLLLYAGDDHLVNPAGSRAFAAAAPAGVVTSHCFEVHARAEPEMGLPVRAGADGAVGRGADALLPQAGLVEVDHPHRPLTACSGLRPSRGDACGPAEPDPPHPGTQTLRAEGLSA